MKKTGILFTEFPDDVDWIKTLNSKDVRIMEYTLILAATQFR